jgi:hypothetical protein
MPPIAETIFFVGLKRSGHHAVLNWFARNKGCPVIHYNDCHIGEGQLVAHEPGLAICYHGSTLRYLLTQPSAQARRLVEAHYGASLQPHLLHFSALNTDSEGSEDSEIAAPSTVIYSFEDRHPQYLAEAARVCRPDRVITVVRDPLNFIASCIKHAEACPEVWDQLIANMGERLAVWRHQAAQLLEDAPGFLNTINYNEWFRSKDYRDKIAQRNGFFNQDIGVDEVLLFGHGSSFDHLQYAERASAMAVLDRWRSYADDETFRRFVTDDLIDLAWHLFGVSYRPHRG